MEDKSAESLKIKIITACRHKRLHHYDDESRQDGGTFEAIRIENNLPYLSTVWPGVCESTSSREPFYLRRQNNHAPFESVLPECSRYT